MTDHADLIFVGGRVHTVNATNDVVPALAVGGGRVLAAGGDTEMRALAGPGARVVDVHANQLLGVGAGQRLGSVRYKTGALMREQGPHRRAARGMLGGERLGYGAGRPVVRHLCGGLDDRIGGALAVATARPRHVLSS